MSTLAEATDGFLPPPKQRGWMKETKLKIAQAVKTGGLSQKFNHFPRSRRREPKK